MRASLPPLCGKLQRNGRVMNPAAPDCSGAGFAQAEPAGGCGRAARMRERAAAATIGLLRRDREREGLRLHPRTKSTTLLFMDTPPHLQSFEEGCDPPSE